MGAPFHSSSQLPSRQKPGWGTPKPGHPIQPLLSHDSQEDPTLLLDGILFLIIISTETSSPSLDPGHLQQEILAKFTLFSRGQNCPFECQRCPHVPFFFASLINPGLPRLTKRCDLKRTRVKPMNKRLSPHLPTCKNPHGSGGAELGGVALSRCLLSLPAPNYIHKTPDHHAAQAEVGSQFLDYQSAIATPSPSTPSLGDGGAPHPI